MLRRAKESPGDGVNIEQVVVTLREAVEPTALKAAWEYVIARRDTLRMAFSDNAQFFPMVRLPWHQEDYQRFAPAELEQLEEFIAAERAKPFDMERPPLLRVALFQIAPREWRMVWTFHHAVLDGRSAALVLREVFTSYGAIAAGEAPGLHHPPEFRSYLEMCAGTDESEAFWRENLAGLSEAPLPEILFPLKSASSERAGRISRADSALVRSAAERMGCTVATLVHAAWALVLARHCEMEDVVFGEVRSGRSDAVEHVSDIAGMCVNTAPLRVRVSPGVPVEAWLRGIGEARRAIRPHEHTDLADIQQWSGINPIVRSAVMYERGTFDALVRAGVEGWSGRRFELRENTGLPLTLCVHDGDEISFRLAMSPAKPAALLAFLARRFAGALVAIARTGGDSLVGDLPIADDAELKQIAEWSTGEAVELPSALLHTPFVARAAEQPEAQAVVWSDGALTYSQLHRRALAVAAKLAGGKPVAIVMEKGWEQVAAVLGVLYAGAAYVPVDVSLPPVRRNQFLKLAGVETALVQPGASFEEWPAGIKRIAVTAEESNAETPAFSQGDTDLAYIIFTSGSTGQPKGVMIDHRGALNTCLDVNRRHRVAAGDRVLALSSLSFDLSVWDIFGTLAAGAAIVLPDAADARDPRHWVEVAARDEVTIWNSVPALLRLAVEQVESGSAPRPAKLRLALLSGDWIPLDLPSRFCAIAPEGAEVISMGGATEASIWSNDFRISSIEPGWRSIPYGRAMANQTMQILDEGLRPCPIMIAGDIYIGGCGVARGYWGDEERTASAFITHPVSGERLYRTGDRGRWMAEGQIEFLGRKDFQVKVQGFRIELDEIETLLRKHAAVGDAAVVARGERAEEKQLAAYVTPRGEKRATPVELRDFLSVRLPVWMVPASFTVLDEFPRGTSGKLERAALPEAAAADIPVELSDPLEALVCRELGRGSIGEDVNFIELGATSLGLIALATAIERQFGFRLRLAELYQTPTLAGIRAMQESETAKSRSKIFKIARRIRELGGPEREAALEEEGGALDAAGRALLDTLLREPVPFTGPLPVTPAQRAVWMLEQFSPNQTAYNVPLVWKISGEVNSAALKRSVALLLERHPVLRARFGGGVEEPLQIIEAFQPAWIEQVFAFEDLSKLEGDALSGAILTRAAAEMNTRFDFGRIPLMRVRLLQTGPATHVLLWTLHHLITDEQSLALMFGELKQAYSAFCTDGSSELVPRGDYAAAVFAHNGAASQHVAWWKEHLAGAPEHLDVHLDRPRPARMGHVGASVVFQLGMETVASANAFASARGITLFPVLLSAFAAVLGRSAGCEDLVVGAAARNREFPGGETVAGFFTNILPLRLNISSTATFGRLARSAHAEAAESFAREQTPFDVLPEALGHPLDPSRNPVFQHLFVLLTEPADSQFALEGAEVVPLTLGSTTSKFDLSLFLSQRSDGTMTARLEYNSALYEEVTASRLAERFRTLLDAALVEPERAVGELKFVGEAEAGDIAEWTKGDGFRVLNVNGADVAAGVIGSLTDKDGKSVGEAFRMFDGGIGRPEVPAVACDAASMGSRMLLHTQLIEVWEAVLEKRPIGIRDNFFRIGGRSLAAVKMLAQVEQRFGKRIMPAQFFERPTIEGLSIVLRAGVVEGGNPWMLLNAGGQRRPFIYLHGDYCGGFYTHDMARQLGPDQPVVAVHPHGITGGSMPGNIRDMAADRIAALKKAGYAGPWVLGGYCNGAFVALEMARQLEAAGEEAPVVVMLMADGSNLRFRGLSKMIRGMSFSCDEATKEQRFLRARNKMEFAGAAGKKFSDRSLGDKVGTVFRKAGKIVGLGSRSVPVQEASEAAAQAACSPRSPFADITSIYVRAIQAYVPANYGGKIVCLWPEEEESEWHVEDPARGWREVAKEAEAYKVPGGHFTVISEPEYLALVTLRIAAVLGTVKD